MSDILGVGAERTKLDVRPMMHRLLLHFRGAHRVVAATMANLGIEGHRPTSLLSARFRTEVLRRVAGALQIRRMRAGYRL